MMNSVCLKISLLVLLAVVGETGSFPPAHLPFPLSSLAGCEHSDMTFMAVSSEQAFRGETPQQGYPTETSDGAAVDLLICGCKDADQPSILTILFLAVTKLCFIPRSTHWPLLTQPDWWL